MALVLEPLQKTFGERFGIHPFRALHLMESIFLIPGALGFRVSRIATTRSIFCAAAGAERAFSISAEVWSTLCAGAVQLHFRSIGYQGLEVA